MGSLQRASAHILARQFASDYFGWTTTAPLFDVVAVAPVLEEAASVTERHGLRAYDAVQLASAVAVRTANPGRDTFCAFDKQLAIAARNEGFRVVQ